MMNPSKKMADKTATAGNVRPENQVITPQVIRISDLASTPAKQGKLPVSPATIWRWVREGKFPKPFKLGESTTVWDLAEVDAFLAQCAGGAA